MGQRLPRFSFPDGAEQDPFYRLLVEHMQDGVFVTRDQRFLFVNRAAADTLGYTVGDLTGRPIREVIAPEDLDRVLANHHRRQAGDSAPARYEFHMLHKDGHTRIPVMMAVTAVEFPDGQVGTLGSFKDISEQKALFRQVEESEKEFRLIVENMPDIFYRTDAKGRLLMVNGSVRLLGWEPDELLGHTIEDFCVTPGTRATVLDTVSANRGERTRVEFQVCRRDGSTAWLEAHVFFRADAEGRFCGTEGIARDITDRKKMEERLRHLAGHDALTGLPNRSHLATRLDGALARARRTGDRVAVLFIDLDDFKVINDREGHRTGDRVLVEAATRLRNCIREKDAIGRLGGDEFTAILEDDVDQALAEQVAARMLDALARAYPPDLPGVTLSASIGISLFPEHGDTLDTLLSRADAAMYAAKQQDHGHVRIWTPDLEERTGICIAKSG